MILNGVIYDSDIEVASMQTDDAAIVNLEMVIDGQVYRGEGSSKRAPGETRNYEFGYKLALTRALSDLTDSVLNSEGFYFDD